MKSMIKRWFSIYPSSLSVLFVGAFLLFSVSHAQAQTTTTCPAWTAKSYPKDSCVTYQGATYKTQWWANAEDTPKVGPNPWDTPWVLVDGSAPPPPPPTESEKTPGKPRINWMTANWAPGQSIPLSWTLDWGVVGTQWEVIANGNSVFKGSSFSSTGSNTQTGKTDLALADGKYDLVVKLCNTAGCADSDKTSIVVGADASVKPTAPGVTAIGNINQGQNIPVKWNMYWGNIGSRWEVAVDGKNVYSSQNFTTNQANTQAGETILKSQDLKLANGQHRLTVKLCTSECSEGSVDFTVGGDLPPVAPSKPVVAPIADTEVSDVTLNWSVSDNGVDEFVKGSSWYVTDTLNGNTSVVYPSSTQFGADDTAKSQSGSAKLKLGNGTHALVVQLCTTATVCTASNPVSVKVTLPPPPVPGKPNLAPVSDSNNGKVTIGWQTTGNGGDYWQIYNTQKNSVIQRVTQFTDETHKAGNQTINLPNGSYSVSVKLCNIEDVCAESDAKTFTVSGASNKKSFFMSYYPTWFDNTPADSKVFCPTTDPRYYDYETKSYQNCAPGKVLPDATIAAGNLLAGGIPDYVTHVVIAFGKLNQMHLYKGISRTNGDLSALGLSVNTNSAVYKELIRVLKSRNPETKVLLALGGAAYNDSWNNVTQADIDATALLMKDLDLDGLDVDYEVGGVDDGNINKYYAAIQQMRESVDKANAQTGKQAILTLPGWSTGADCIIGTQNKELYPDCYLGKDQNGKDLYKVAYWGGNAGRERLVLQGKGANSMMDLVTVMSYDADYQHYDPVVAYQQYRNIVKPGTPVGLGIQVSPDEGWGNSRTLVDDRGIDNDCVGNTILEDQYRNPKPGTFSVQRFANVVLQNPGDGMMMWSLFAGRSPQNCGSVKLSTGTDLARGVSEYLGIGSDRTLGVDKSNADTYGNRN